MKIDLESALTDLARSVHDDGVTDRMNGQVRQMVGRIRRRRVARYSATGVVGIGAVAAVAVGGLQLADRYTSSVPPATQEPDPLVSQARCGEPAPEVPYESGTRFGSVARTGELYLQLGPIAPVPAGSALSVSAELVNGSDEPMSWTDSAVPARFHVVQDDVVLATGELGAARTVERFGAGEVLAWRESVELVSCGGERTAEPLPAGTYALVVAYPLELEGGEEIEVAASSRFTITEAPSDETAAAEAEIQAIIATSAEVSAQYPFGTCGTEVPATANDLLTIEMELASTSFAAGDLMEGTSAVTARDGLTVLGNSPVTAAHVVLTRDGVVVGRGDYDPEHIALNTFTTDTPYPLPALGNALLCNLPDTEASGLDLPPGEYQAYATLEVALKEIQYPDGNAESRSDLVVIHSDPVDITID